MFVVFFFKFLHFFPILCAEEAGKYRYRLCLPLQSRSWIIHKMWVAVYKHMETCHCCCWLLRIQTRGKRKHTHGVLHLPLIWTTSIIKFSNYFSQPISGGGLLGQTFSWDQLDEKTNYKESKTNTLKSNLTVFNRLLGFVHESDVKGITHSLP